MNSCLIQQLRLPEEYHSGICGDGFKVEAETVEDGTEDDWRLVSGRAIGATNTMISKLAPGERLDPLNPMRGGLDTWRN